MIMNDIVLTLDVDWAPDFVIDFVAVRLIEYKVRATWFVTHRSEAIERLRQHPDLFELGIHPNFLSCSTHGSTPEEILQHCMTLVPEATSMRTHGLYQSTLLLAQIMIQTPITTDVSLFLPHTPFLCPVEYRWGGRDCLRIPYFWEDDFEMERDPSCWYLSPLLAKGEGLKVFNFHPMHVYLNSANVESYKSLKEHVLWLTEASPVIVDRYIYAGLGTQTLFMELTEYLAASKKSLRICDISRYWRESAKNHCR
jgi:hypothetical protein